MLFVHPLSLQYDFSMSLTPEEIEQNFLKFASLCTKLGDRSEAATRMVETLGERLAVCPASGRMDFHACFPGGLVDHSLRVLGNAMKLCKAFEWSLPKDSLIIGTLFHDLGKVGDHEQDYYVPQTEQWRADKNGEIYTFNKNIQYMTVPDRGVFLCQHFGLRLTQAEHLAIKLNDGWVVQENKAYCLKEPLLVHVVQTADYISTMQEKGSFE
jgi:hypothetical protein